MRVYVPATSATLRALVRDRELGAPITAFAVTAGLREWYVDDDIDELEYAAMRAAARASLRLIDADPAAARRRIVIAADAADAIVTVRDDLDAGAVRIDAPLAMQSLASVHVDEPDARAAVAAGASAILSADLGSQADQDVVDDVEGFELAWYATQEIEGLLGEL